ncbi:MAG: hypothetical protein IJR44_05710, partial [Neisseriaceae bacterium]|nr:hypothetical protein [Neisseriaceae bacterium]
MGLLDSLVSKAVGSAVSSALGGGRGNAGDQGLAMSLIGALMKQSGGASGLFSQLQGGGLGNALASWSGKGQTKQSAVLPLPKPWAVICWVILR